jgi:hypothetical protein
LVEDAQHNFPLMHLLNKRDWHLTVLWYLAQMAEKDMRHLLIMPIDDDRGHSTCFSTFASQDYHVPTHFDCDVTLMV